MHKLLLCCLMGLLWAAKAKNINSIEVDSMENKVIKELEGSDFLTRAVNTLVDFQIISKEDLTALARQSRTDNPLSELFFGVFKELVSTVLTETVGSYLGVASTERSTFTEDFNLLEFVMAAVRKNTIQKRMGCPE